MVDKPSGITSHDVVARVRRLAAWTLRIQTEVGKQLGMRHVPTIDFIADALPENARHIDDLLERVREADAAAAQSASAGAYAGEPDPYKKPRDPVDDELDLAEE